MAAAKFRTQKYSGNSCSLGNDDDDSYGRILLIVVIEFSSIKMAEVVR